MSPGSYGGSDVVISDKQNIAIVGVNRGQGTICELSNGRGLTLSSSCNGSITISSLQIEGLLTLAGKNNNYFTSLQCKGGITIPAYTIGNYFFSDCEISGLVTVPATFGGLVTFSRCNMSGATFSLSNPSPLQVQFALCINLPLSRPTNATYGSSNSDANLNITTDTTNLRIDKSLGTLGQVLTSGGTTGAAYWSSVVGVTGATGAQGPAGPAGADGAQGPVGPAGADGAQGPIGNFGMSLNSITKLKNATSQIVFSFENGSVYRGSGFYYYETQDDLLHGYFVTAAHCVSNTDVSTQLYERLYKGYIQDPTTNTWVTVDPSKIYMDGVADIALIVTDINFTNHAEYCLKINTTPVNYGDVCCVVGNPLVVDEDSFSFGNVRDPHWSDPDGYQVTDTMFINAPSGGGNSGGPIVNTNADVIGIYTFIFTNYESFGGGSNQYVLQNSLNVLKTESRADYKSKIYLGFDWSIVSPYQLSDFYAAGSTSFAREGVKVSSINTSSPIYKSDSSGIMVGDLLISCVVTLPSAYTGTTLLTNILFGNQTTQRTPGLLIYYPVGTEVVFSYRRTGDTGAARQITITLNKTYTSENIPNYIDGPLQGINRTNTINRKLTKNLPVVSE